MEMMRLKYIGPSFGVESLTDEKVYDCLGVELGFVRVIDDSDEDYLYSPINPRPLDASGPGGRWEIIEDDENGTLGKLISQT